MKYLLLLLITFFFTNCNGKIISQNVVEAEIIDYANKGMTNYKDFNIVVYVDDKIDEVFISLGHCKKIKEDLIGLKTKVLKRTYENGEIKYFQHFDKTEYCDD